MKLNRAFIVLIIVLMVVMLLFETTAPNRYRWDDYSQSHFSKQPFGCYVMDSVLRASLPQGYDVVGPGNKMLEYKTLKSSKRTYLFTNNYNDFANSISSSVLNLIKDGNNVVIASDNYYFHNDINERLEFSIQSIDYKYYSSAKEELSNDELLDYVDWHPGERFSPATYRIKSAFCHHDLYLSDSSYRTLATIDKEISSYYGSYTKTITVAGIRDYGKGKVIVVSMPLIFTNYGILDNNMRPLALRLLSECGDLPVVRFDSTLTSSDDEMQAEEGSPLRYLLSHRPLRWAFYLALATLVAFVFFSARRRQRVIPVVKPPKNHMMDFVKRIGGIYFQRHDNLDLLIKKCAMFSNTVRAKTMIDLNNYDHIDEEFQALASRTGIPFEELKKQIYDLWSETHLADISDERLKELIDVMNNILKKINI